MVAALRRLLCAVVVALALFVGVPVRGSGADLWAPKGTAQQENENRELDLQLQTVRTILDSRESASLSSQELMGYWRAYALMLQTKDNNQHYGAGALQPEALRAFDKALALNEQLGGALDVAIEMHYHKGILLETMGRGEEALVHFKAVRDLAEGSSDRSIAISQMANVMSLMDRTAEAKELHLEALRTTPWRLEVYLALVECYKELKELDKAGWLKLAGEMKAALREYGSSKFLDKPVSQKTTGKSYLDTNLIKDMYRSPIYWALFDAYDHAGELSSAWEYLDQAHEIEWEVKRAKHEQQIDIKMQTEQIKSIFQPGFWMSNVGHKSMDPIFIVGMMRCGSTLLETMLHSHGEVWGMGENSAFNGNLPAFREELVAVISSAQRKIEHNTRTGQALQTFDSGDINSLVTNYGNFIIKKMRETIDKSWKTEPHRSGKDILRVVDKMVFNYRNIGFIHMVFPRALIVHIVRDPMDTLLSCYRRKFDDNGLEWALDADELALNYAMYLDVMHHFRTALPGRVLDVRFEKLVTDPETELRKISAAAGVDYDPNMLLFHQTRSKTQMTHSRSQVRQGLYSSHIGGWRKYAQQLRPIIAAMKKHLPALRKKGALPFLRDMNWNLDPGFDYASSLNRTAASAADDDEEEEDDEEEQVGKESAGEDEEEMSEEDEDDDEEGEEDEEDEDGEYDEDDDEYDEDDEYYDDEEEEEEGKGEEKDDRLSRAKEMFRQARRELSAAGKENTELRGKDKAKARKEKATKGKAAAPVQVEVGSDGGSTEAAPVRSSPKASKPRKQKQQRQGHELTAANSRELRVSARQIRELQASFPSVPYAQSVSTGRGPDRQLLWDLFAYAHSYTNRGEFAKGVEVFDKLIGAHRATLLELLQAEKNNVDDEEEDEDSSIEEHLSTLPAPVTELFRGMGTALALMGQLQYALPALDQLLEIGPEDVDGLTRRAEVLTALGSHSRAREDLDEALRLSPKSEMRRELLVNRGMAEFRNREFRAAYRDFLEAKDLPAPKHSQNTVARLWNYIGKCEQEFSEWRRSIESQDRALAADPKHKEAHYDKAIALISASIWRPAIREFERVIELDANYKNAHGYRGLLYQNLGRPADAVESFDEALRIDPNDTMVLLLKGVCLHALGRYAEAVKSYNRLIALEPGHYCINRREAAIYAWVRAATPVSQFNMDDELNPYTKMGINKQTVYSSDVFGRLGDDDFGAPRRRGVKAQQRQTAADHFSREAQRRGWLDANLVPTTKGMKRSRALAKPLSEEALSLVLQTQPLAKWLQLKHHGFLVNRRQHRQFALAVLEMAQALRKHVEALRDGDRGLLLSDAATSSVESFGFQPATSADDDAVSASAKHHVFGWRDLFDIAGRWRQVAEPMDAVWWIDRLPTPTSYKDRIGLNTFMIHGSNKVIRYYPQMPRAQAMTRQLMLSDGFYNPAEELTQVAVEHRQALANTTTLKGLHVAANREAFFVITHVSSLAQPGVDLSGIRLTLQRGEPEGWDFSICVPSTPERFAQYEEEIHYAVERTVSTLREALDPDSLLTPEMRNYHVKRRALELFYYWANFGAFTRGTSATGYAAMYAVLASGGLEITAPLPKGTQLDWEAFFSPDPEAFVRAAMPWLQTQPLGVNPGPGGPNSLPQVSDVFSSFQGMVDAINVETDADAADNQAGELELEL